MKRHMFLTLAVVLMLAADDSKKDGNDAKKLEGTWSIESIEVDGQKTPEDEVKRFKLTIDGDKYTMKADDTVTTKGKLKLDSSKKPKSMDIMPSEGDNVGEKLLGIYELDGMKLKVCFCGPNRERPSKIAADSGSGHTVVIAVKDKKEKKETQEKDK